MAIKLAQIKLQLYGNFFPKICPLFGNIIGYQYIGNKSGIYYPSRSQSCYMGKNSTRKFEILLMISPKKFSKLSFDCFYAFQILLSL